MREKTIKPNTKKLDKKQHIVEAALTCFSQHGVEATTIDMIREESGMSVGSLYHHFGNKEKIAAAVYRRGMASFGQLARSYLNDLPKNKQNAESGVKALVYANIDWITNNPNWARFVFLQRSTANSDDSEENLQQDIKGFYQELIQWFIPHLGTGEIKPLPLELYSSLVTGPTHSYARHWLAGRCKTPLIEHKEVLANAAWKAIT